MMTLIELRENLHDLSTKFQTIWDNFNFKDNKLELKKLESKAEKPGFWEDINRAKAINQNISQIQGELDHLKKIKLDLQEIGQLIDVSIEENSDELLAELVETYNNLKTEINKLEVIMLFSGKYDQNNAIINISAGTGGTEAQDWANMLERMYLHYAEKKNWSSTIINRNVGAEAGIKNVSIEINGRYVYGNLKAEAGVHRLVRISPFDAEKMRHTSFALVEVSPVVENDDQNLQIDDKDLKIDTFRSSGHGGQSVNTTDSAVRMTHLPSGIIVNCQNERSQLQNKEQAMKILKSKLAKLMEEQQVFEIQNLKGEHHKAAWSNQIRSYVLQPYTMVKDHRTNFESKNPSQVLDGEIDDFIFAYLNLKKDN